MQVGVREESQILEARRKCLAQVSPDPQGTLEHGELKGHVFLVVSLWGTTMVPVRRVFISILH